MTLITHNPRFQSKLATFDQLVALPPPPRLGRWHRPIPHSELIAAIRAEADRRGLVALREQFALGAKGAAIFGVIDFGGQSDERSTSLGFRNSTDQSLRLQAVAGAHVFVCDNLALSGEWDTWAHKNTLGLDLLTLVRRGFEEFARRAEAFDKGVQRLASVPLSDTCARAKLWEVFTDGTLPSRLLGVANTAYFRPEEAWTDCQPRTLWGLHNALTRVARELTPTRVLDASSRIGWHFGLGVN